MKLERIIVAAIAALSVAGTSCKEEMGQRRIELSPATQREIATHELCKEENTEPQPTFTPFQEQLCLLKDDPVPRSVREYEHYVINNSLKYAPMGDESYCHLFSARYLDRKKKGVCDEFALNALLHLLNAPDIKELYLVSYGGDVAKPFHACDGWTTRVGHMILVYENMDGSFGSISNGQDESLLSVSLRNLIDQSAKENGFLGLNRMKYIPKSDICCYLKWLLFDDTSGRDILDEIYPYWHTLL